MRSTIRGLKKLLRKLFSFFFLTFIFSSCEPNSLEDFREEMNEVVRELVVELRMIRSREDLLAREKKLEMLFESLVDVVIAANSLKLEERENVFGSGDVVLPSNQDLKRELERLYALEGGTQIIEKYQEHALQRLEAFERRSQKAEER